MKVVRRLRQACKRAVQRNRHDGIVPVDAPNAPSAATALDHVEPVTPIGRAINQTAMMSTNDLCEVLHEGQCGRWRQRFLGAWALGRRSMSGPMRIRAAAALQAALHIQYGSADVSGRFVLAIKRTFFAGALIALLIALYAVTMGEPVDAVCAGFVPGFVFLFCLLIGPGVFVSGLIEDRRLGRVRRAAAHTLGLLAVPGSAGPLARAALDHDARVRASAVYALIRVLKALTPEDYGQLDADTVPSLCRLLVSLTRAYGLPPLRTVANPRLATAILDGLAKVGDGRAVDLVAELARACQDDTVAAVAQRALPVLQERQRRERETGRLLRASSAPDDAAGTLLHPASSAPATDTATLVRSANVVSGQFDD